MHQLFEGFLQTDDGEPMFCNYPAEPGVLNKDQMKNLMAEVKPDMTDEEFEARFQRIDEDGSGEIEFDEFAIWVRQDEVRIVGVSSRKLSLQELAELYNESMQVVGYIHSLFLDLMPEDEDDDYPQNPGSLAKP